MRLLFACLDIVRTGHYRPRLQGAVRECVINARLGRLTFDAFSELVASLRTDIEAAAPESPLPRTPNTAAVDALLLELSLGADAPMLDHLLMGNTNDDGVAEAAEEVNGRTGQEEAPRHFASSPH